MVVAAMKTAWFRKVSLCSFVGTGEEMCIQNFGGEI
jgi:hypothetical protein